MPVILRTEEGSCGVTCGAVALAEKTSTLEELLASDQLFIDYFNMFLQLPSFPEPVVYNRLTGGFEVQSRDVKSSLTADVRNAVRLGRATKPLYDVTKKHSFSPISIIAIEKQPPEIKHVKTIFNVQTLDMEQGIEWVKTERLPAFLDSDCYLEYRLAKLLSQCHRVTVGAFGNCLQSAQSKPSGQITTERRPLPSELLSIRLIIAQSTSYDTEKDRNITNAQWLNTRLLMSKLYISSGNTPTSQTDLYVNQAKSHFSCNTTQSSGVTSHSSRMTSSAVKSSADRLPDPVCVVDKRYIRPACTFFAEQQSTRRPSSNVSQSVSGTGQLQSGVDDRRTDSTLNEDIESETSVDGENESTFNSDDDYENEADIALFCEHRRPRSTSGKVLSTLSGVQSLLNFLRGNAGEKYWSLWLDIERAKGVHNNEELQRELIGMRERYYNSGSPLELPAESKKQLHLLQPSDWNMSRLNFVQAKLLEPLINYWVPRFLSEQQGKPQLDGHHDYQQQLKLKPRPASCPEPRTALYQPHRPQSCKPRDRIRATEIHQQSPVTMVTSPIRRAYSAAVTSTAVSKRRPHTTIGRHIAEQRVTIIGRGQAQQLPPAWQPSPSPVSDQFNGSHQMESLLQALRYDNDAGKVFRKHVEKSMNSLWRSCLRFWQCCQEYHKQFYMEVIDNFLIEKKAKYIYATFLLPSSAMNISCEAKITQVIGENLATASAELFDDAEEHVLSVLYVAWCDAMLTDSSTYNKVDKLNVRRRLNASLNISQPTTGDIEVKTGQCVQTIIIEEEPAELSGVTSDSQTGGILAESRSSAEGPPQVPPKFRDISLLKIVQNRFELEHFRRYLSENYASLDLVCWLDIEALRRIPTVQGDIKTRKAMAIRRKYFNINYFFGPNSPATKPEQDKMMNALGGRTGLILDLPPSIESLYTAQQYIERRLDSKWLPLFLATPQFAERQRLSLGMSHVVDDVVMQRRRRALTIQKLLGNKWQVSQEKINQFRMSLLNPLTSQLFRRFISIKGEFHVNNVLFWLEIEKFKELCQLNTDYQMMQQKANAIINCFLDSQIPPAVQVTVEPELVQVVLERRNVASENMFKEAQRRVFIELMPQWNEFCKYRQENQVSDDQLLALLDERRRQSNKSTESRKELRRNEKQNRLNTANVSRRRSLTSTSNEFDPFESIENDSSVSWTTGGADSMEPTVRSQFDWSSKTQKRNGVISWTYSRYIQALNKEQSLNQTSALTTSSLPVPPSSESVSSHPNIEVPDSLLDSESLNVIRDALNTMASQYPTDVTNRRSSQSQGVNDRPELSDTASTARVKVKKTVRVLSPTSMNSGTAMTIG